MRNLDELERSVIEAAQRGLAPSASVAARVRSRALSAVAAGVSVPHAQPDAFERVSSASTEAWESLRDGPTRARLLLGAIALCGAGAGGYALGLRAGRAETRAPTVAVQHGPAASSLESAPAAPAAVVAAKEPEEAVAPTRRHAASGQGSAGVAAAKKPDDPEAELRALRRIERVLREQNPRLALALLSELDREVPGGKLLEERQTARTVANCALDDSASVANSRAAEFAARYPGSVYAPRVQQACSVQEPARERIPTAAETDDQQ
jgi:hypothetical protein